MNKIRYVLMVAVDPVQRSAVGLIKTKGPEFLIGKITFPGGKIEQNETVEEAASREFLEEAGVKISPEEWLPVGYKGTDEFELYIVAALSYEIKLARTMEEEPIFLMSLDEHYRAALYEPAKYTPDFMDIVTKCLTKLGLEPA